MKKKMGVLTMVLLLIFGIAQIASAAGFGMGGGGGPRMLSGDNWGSPVDTLNLTDQQISKMQEIQKNTYDKTRDLKIKLMDSRFQLRQLQLQKNLDKAQIDTRINEINDLRSELYGITQKNREQCQSLLTQEQLAQMAKNRGFGMGAKGGMGFGRSITP